MNKTINLNIGGTVFNVDEDAYELLNKYIESIKIYFKNIDEDGEIIKDIESRIAENLSKNISRTSSSVSILDVKKVITVMGTLNDFKEIYDDQNEDDFSETKSTKRLYRNPQDKVLGGVASGIANYFNIDPVIIRIIFLTLLFVGGFGLIAYIIFWIGIPSKDGSEVLLDKRLYRDKEDKVVGGVAMGISNYLSVDVSIIRVLFLISIFFGGLGVLIYLLLWIITPEATTISQKMRMSGHSINLKNIEEFIKNKINPVGKSESPLEKILLFPFRALGPIVDGTVKLIRPAFNIFLGGFLFILSLVVIFFSVFLLLNHLEVIDQIPVHILNSETNLEIDGINFSIIVNEIPLVILSTIYLNLFLTLTLLIMMMTKILFNRSLVRLPLSMSLFFVWLILLSFNSIALPMIADKWNKEGKIDEWKNSGVIENFSIENFSSKTYNISDFNKIDISVPAKVSVKESDMFSVEVFTSEKNLKNLIVRKNSDDELEILSKNYKWNWGWNSSDIKIQINLPSLTSLDLSGATQTDVEFEMIDRLELELSGAAHLDIHSDISNLNAKISGASDFELDGKVIVSVLRISGASRLDLEGEGEKMDVRVSGASKFDGRDFVVSSIEIASSGASSAYIHSLADVSIKASAASSVYDYGNGNIKDFDISSAATYKKRSL